MYDVPKDCNFFTEFESNLWLMLQQTTKKLKNFPKNFQLKFQTQTEKTSLLFLLTKPGSSVRSKRGIMDDLIWIWGYGMKMIMINGVNTMTTN